MSKKTEQRNFRVVIEPAGLGQFRGFSVVDRLFCRDEADRQRQYRERCEEIVRDVKRHVDNVGMASVECDIEGECEHCGSRWTEESDDYNGGCCDKDQAAQDARDAATGEAALADHGFPKALPDTPAR